MDKIMITDHKAQGLMMIWDTFKSGEKDMACAMLRAAVRADKSLCNHRLYIKIAESEFGSYLIKEWKGD